MFKNALVSCSDKSNLSEFLKPLQKNGLRIVSTGGTAQYLREQGLKIVEVSEQTQFQEVMDGRVKTLHPNVHMALLARSDNAEDMNTLKKFNLEPFDLVVGNLYPFEEEPSIETIDIGGPSFLRAAAKNFSRITVVCDPQDYKMILEKKELTREDRQLLASKVFAHTSAYDAMISSYFAGKKKYEFRELSLGGKFVKQLRYGENPQQEAQWFRVAGESHGIHKAEVIQGKELSYNNILDIDAAVSTLLEFKKPTCVAVKHNNPCGVASHSDEVKAVQLTIDSDPQSIFGGIVALNFNVSEAVAEKLSTLFLECVVAPHFTTEALTLFAKKKNLRILQWPEMLKNLRSNSYKTIAGGFLTQSPDYVASEWHSDWIIVGEEPTQKQKEDLLFAWKVCAHLKSNAIALATSQMTVGLGMGQVNRVDAVQQAIERMNRFHPQTNSAVLASDAFFPFPDSIEKIAAAGVKCIIQPGGSIKDDEVKEAAKKLGITMVLTGRRHFLH